MDRCILIFELDSYFSDNKTNIPLTYQFFVTNDIVVITKDFL